MDGGKELILSERLLAIAQWIPPGSRVADIGTDHGYLPIWLLQHGCAAFIAACDVREGPLEHARRSAAQYGLQEKLSFRLGSGLSCVAPDEIDTIVIAGMGGETILSILEASPWTNDARYTLLLQPMTKAEVLRPWLSEQGYVFLKERLGLENRTYFPIMARRRYRPAAFHWTGVGRRCPAGRPFAGQRLGCFAAPLYICFERAGAFHCAEKPGTR